MTSNSFIFWHRGALFIIVLRVIVNDVIEIASLSTVYMDIIYKIFMALVYYNGICTMAMHSGKVVSK